MKTVLKCPKCKSTKIGQGFEGENKSDDLSHCETCDYQGSTEDSIYGKGFIQETVPYKYFDLGLAKWWRFIPKNFKINKEVTWDEIREDRV